jgi:hypothetical protein
MLSLTGGFFANNLTSTECSKVCVVIRPVNRLRTRAREVKDILKRQLETLRNLKQQLTGGEKGRQ